MCPQEIVEDLEAALEQFREISMDLAATEPRGKPILSIKSKIVVSRVHGFCVSRISIDRLT
jgi:hypothetical protein